MEKMNQERRKPKGPIKFKISLNEEQKEAKTLILQNPVTVIKGAAGSGKTLLAAQVALDLLFNREIEKIIITRPTVATTGSGIGFLKGDLEEKMLPWMAPIYANLELLYDKSKIDKLLEDGQIEILPFDFMRGRTFVNCYTIIDEAQNITSHQMEMVLTRLGQGSKMVICGDGQQIDLVNKKESGFGFLSVLESRIKGVKSIELKKNHRHEIVPEIIKIYEENAKMDRK
jgi:phosphate starvation-inducible protein PhoH and related proteins